MRQLRLFTFCFCVLLLAALAGAQQPAPRLNKVLLRWQALNEPGSGGALTSLSINPQHAEHYLLGGDMLGIALSRDAGLSWQPAFGLLSWEVADFTWHPTQANVVWVGTMSGPHVSFDGGRHWQARRAGLPPLNNRAYSAPIQKVLFDPADSEHLLAFGGSHRRWASPGAPAWGAVWESHDGGVNWSRKATIGEGRNILEAAFAAHSSTTLYTAVDGRGVFVSIDGGATWAARNEGLPHGRINDLAVSPRQAETLWVALDNFRPEGATTFQQGGVYRSTDGGASWHNASTGLHAAANSNTNLAARYRSIAVAPTDPARLITCDTSWSGSTAYVSRDGGDSWQVLARKSDLDVAMPAGLGMTVLEFAPQSAETILLAGTEYIVRTRDGGLSWLDVTARRVSADGETPRRDAGRSFAGWVATNFEWHPREAGRAVLQGFDHANFYESRDELQSWRWGGVGLPTWEGGNDVAFANDDVVYVALGQAGFSSATLARSRDGGRTWTRLQGKPGLPAGTPVATSVHTLFADGNQVWATINGGLYASADGGESWRGLGLSGNVRALAAAPQDDRQFYVSGEAGVYATRDGANFQLLAGSPARATKMTVDAQGRLYVTAWRANPGGLWRYDASGWTRLRNDTYIAAVAVDPGNAARLAVATDDAPFHDACFCSGIWLSADDGQTWSQQNAGLPMLRGASLTFNPHQPGQLVFGSSGRGFFTAYWKDRVPPRRN